MDKRTNKEIQDQFIKKAKGEGVTVCKNNIDLARPLSEICGSITTKYPTSTRDLICGR